MIGRQVATKEEMDQMKLDEMNKFMQDNAGKTIEVPVNLLYALSQFLDVASNRLDEGNIPYPSMQWSTGSLSYLLREKFVPFRDKIPGTAGMVYDTIHKVNTQNGHDIDIDAVMSWIETGEIDEQ